MDLKLDNCLICKEVDEFRFFEEVIWNLEDIVYIKEYLYNSHSTPYTVVHIENHQYVLKDEEGKLLVIPDCDLVPKGEIIKQDLYKKVFNRWKSLSLDNTHSTELPKNILLGCELMSEVLQEEEGVVDDI